MTLDEQVEFTKNWWSRLCKDESLMIKWLQKLYWVEWNGFADWALYVANNKGILDNKTNSILTNISQDELNHSDLIEKVLHGRSSKLNMDYPPSTYWEEMNSNITDLKTACAVNYYGEALAAFRFEILAEHKETPDDVKEMLRIVLPDEQFHRTTLKNLAGDEALAQLKEKHEEAMRKLRGS